MRELLLFMSRVWLLLLTLLGPAIAVGCLIKLELGVLVLAATVPAVVAAGDRELFSETTPMEEDQ